MEIYTTIERTIFESSSSDEFTVKVATKPEEIKALLEAASNTSARRMSWCSLENANKHRYIKVD